jgi:hypothetical protein
MFRSLPARVGVAATVGAVAVAGIVASGAGASAQNAAADRSIAFKVLEKGEKTSLIDVAPKSHTKGVPFVSQGDQLVFVNQLTNEAGKRIGKLSARCSASTAASLFHARFVCDGFFALTNGTMAFATLAGVGTADSGVVTGGTGAYANARGTYTSTVSKHGSQDYTVTLVG